ncbi:MULTISPECIES: ScbR family autoregulator-binding transcription factor [unclassified Streptomyces]|uniref:ScbR family autoregulator-binding transcription factor n=1 Tax=unclassified Streptomyces TaxID=2593676 RepID=UPI00037C4F71|nr:MULTISPECIES: ScbR family autoregulator-binding transcription factor [unclassified Streptomyces]MYT27414.1 TetR family transcriptional regulator [Streptomyces sp. SID8354]
MTMQARAVSTRNALIRSAAQTFDQHGFAHAKLSGISSGAGVSPGALYFHFDTKAAVAAAVEEEADRTLRGLARHVRRKSPSALQALIDISHVYAQHIRWDVVVRAGLHLNSEAPHALDINLRERWFTCVHELLARAVADQTAFPDAAHDDATATIVAATVGVESLGRQNPDWLSRESLAGLWRHLLPGLARPEAFERLELVGTESVINTTGGVLGPRAGLARSVPRARKTQPGSPAHATGGTTRNLRVGPGTTCPLD